MKIADYFKCVNLRSVRFLEARTFQPSEMCEHQSLLSLKAVELLATQPIDTKQSLALWLKSERIIICPPKGTK